MGRIFDKFGKIFTVLVQGLFEWVWFGYSNKLVFCIGCGRISNRSRFGNRKSYNWGVPKVQHSKKLGYMLLHQNQKQDQKVV